jgi:heptosyltransferase-3
VIRPGALGDTVLGLPVLQSIRKKHPESRIVLLGSRAYRGIIPTDVGFNALDDPKWLWLFEPGVKRNPLSTFHEAYVMLNNPDDLLRSLEQSGTKRLHSAKSAPAAGRHVVECLHERLGLEVPQRSPALLHLAPVIKREIIWFHPGSGGPEKCVPLDLLVGYVANMAEAKGWPVTITFGEADGFLKDQPGWNELVRLPGAVPLENRPLEEICREVGGASLFIGNDSGISHLAAGLGVPSIVLFVSTDPAQWVPWVPPDQVTPIDLRGRDMEDPQEREALIEASDEGRPPVSDAVVRPRGTC